MSRLLKSIVSYFLGTVGQRLVVILGTPILVRLLTPGEFGDYAFLWSALQLLGVFIALGAPDGLRKFLAEDRDHLTWKEDVVSFYLKVSVFLALFSALLINLFVALGYVSHFLGDRFAGYFVLLSIAISLRLLFDIFRSILHVRGEEGFAESLRPVAFLVFMSTAIILSYLGYGVTGVMYGIILGYGVVTGVSIVRCRKYFIYKGIMSWPEYLPRRDFISYSLLWFAQALLATTLYQIDVLLLNPLVGSEATGFYKAAVMSAQFVWMVPATMSVTFRFRFSEWWRNREIEKIQSTIQQASRLNLVFVMLLAVGLITLIGPFIRIYFGHAYLPAVTPFYVLIIGIVSYAALHPIMGMEWAHSRPIIALKVTAISATANLLLNLALIPIYGMHGAAIATTIGYLLMFTLHIYSSRQLGINPIGDFRIGRILVVSGITLVVIWPVARIIPTDILRLVLIPPIGFLLYSALSLSLGTVRKDELPSWGELRNLRH